MAPAPPALPRPQWMGYVPRANHLPGALGALMSNISSTWIIIGILVVLVVWIIMIYNAVQEYHTGIQHFPAALIAGPFGFHPQTFFDLGETRAQLDQAPQVKF